MDTPAKYIYGCTLIGCRLNPDLAHGHSEELVVSAFLKRGFSIAAKVLLPDSRFDLAIALHPAVMSIIRRCDSISPKDHSDLATMIAEGTFAFAALLYEDREGSVIEGPIAVYHVSEIDHLVARLVREAGA